MGFPRMTPTTIVDSTPSTTDARVIGLVSSAHFVSHVYILILPPLFPFVRAEFGVTYTELGGVIAIFNILSAALQTPAGFLVDRTSARLVLTGGLMLGAVAVAATSMAPSFYAFAAIFAFAGLANAVYHPANYALLSSRVSSRRMSQGYSIHIFAGFLGTAVAPASLFALASQIGWRGAFLAASLMGLAIASALMVFGNALDGRVSSCPQAELSPAARPADWRVLVSTAILLNLVFFILIAMTSGAVQNYGIVALEALWGVSLPLATTALTANLVMSALAVLLGGLLSARTDRHDVVAMTGLALSAVALLPVALLDLGTPVLIVLMGTAGFFSGLIMPSRDMLVRSVTPPGSFGKVFGFITTGFNIGGIVAPPIFGYLMDHGNPRGVFIGAAGCALVAIPTVLLTATRSTRRSKAV